MADGILNSAFKGLDNNKDCSSSRDNWASKLHCPHDGSRGLMVSMLASGTRVRGFKPSAYLPSEGKWKNLSHVPALWHVKEPSTSLNYDCASKIPCIVPSFFTSRGLPCLCGAWRLWRWMRGTHWGQGFNRPAGCSAEKPHTRPFVYTVHARGRKN
jgi:hypothetical protein